MMSWSSWKEKESIFCTVYFVRRKFVYHFYFISMYSVLNTLSEYCWERTPALSSSLSVWISDFPQCTHICSFSWFSPSVFPLTCFRLRMLFGHMPCTFFCRRQFFSYSGIWRRTYAWMKFTVNEIYHVWIICLCILMKDIYSAVC